MGSVALAREAVARCRGVLSDRNTANLHNIAVKRKRSSLTAEQRVSEQLNHLTSQLGFLSMQGLMSEVEALMPNIGHLKQLPACAAGPSGGPQMPASAPDASRYGAMGQHSGRSLHGASVQAQQRSGADQRNVTMRVKAHDATVPTRHHFRQDLHRANENLPQPIEMDTGPRHHADQGFCRELGQPGLQVLVPPSATSHRHVGLKSAAAERCNQPLQKSLQSCASRSATANAQDPAEQVTGVLSTFSGATAAPPGAPVPLQQRHASMAEQCLGTRVSHEAADIWRRYESYLDRRHDYSISRYSASNRAGCAGTTTAHRPAGEGRTWQDRQPADSTGRPPVVRHVPAGDAQVRVPVGADVQAPLLDPVLPTPLQSLPPATFQAAEPNGGIPHVAATRACTPSSAVRGLPGESTGVGMSVHVSECVNRMDTCDTVVPGPAVAPVARSMTQAATDGAPDSGRCEQQGNAGSEAQLTDVEQRINSVGTDGQAPSTVDDPRDGASLSFLQLSGQYHLVAVLFKGSFSPWCVPADTTKSAAAQRKDRCAPGYMPSDADNVVAAQALVHRTYTLAARGMEFQQRSRIAMMLSKHWTALEKRQRPPNTIPHSDDPPTASWEHHGAEPVTMDTVLSSLKNAAAETGQTSGVVRWSAAGHARYMPYVC